MVEIREVESLRDLKRFVKFPFDLFAGDPRWVPPLILDELNTLRRDKNPAFAYCEAKYWLAYKGGKLAGRVAGIINHSYIEKWQRPLVRFGWLDFIDDFEVCETLLAAVETWAKQNGLSGVHGPQKAKGRLLPFGWLHILRAIKQNDRLDLYLVAVRPGLRAQGVIAWILRDIHEAAAADGIKIAEATPMLQSNLKVTSLWKHYGMRVHRRRRCFYKEVAP